MKVVKTFSFSKDNLDWLKTKPNKSAFIDALITKERAERIEEQNYFRQNNRKSEQAYIRFYKDLQQNTELTKLEERKTKLEKWLKEGKAEQSQIDKIDAQIKIIKGGK